MLKTLNIFVETMILFFQDSLSKLKKQLNIGAFTQKRLKSDSFFSFYCHQTPIVHNSNSDFKDV